MGGDFDLNISENSEVRYAEGHIKMDALAGRQSVKDALQTPIQKRRMHEICARFKSLGFLQPCACPCPTISDGDCTNSLEGTAKVSSRLRQRTIVLDRISIFALFKPNVRDFPIGFLGEPAAGMQHPGIVVQAENLKGIFLQEDLNGSHVSVRQRRSLNNSAILQDLEHMTASFRASPGT